jgi:aspartyl-tRNA synthetase
LLIVRLAIVLMLFSSAVLRRCDAWRRPAMSIRLGSSRVVRSINSRSHNSLYTRCQFPSASRLLSTVSTTTLTTVTPDITAASAYPRQSLYANHTATPSTTHQSLECGDYELIASQETHLSHTYTNLATLDASAIGQQVWIRGRVSSLRAKGNACFLVLRTNGAHTVQACHFKSKENTLLAEASKRLLKYVSTLALESVVDVCGTVVAADVKGCSQQTVEIYIEKIFAVSRAPVLLPFLLEDAARSQRDIDESTDSDRPFVSVAQDTRLNNRWLDLRVPSNNNIMRVRSAISLLFREALLREEFIEINTPKLLPGESEGGSEVFRTDYFGQVACLAQSPQLYKQMAISGDLNRVFEIGPVFRAEKSMTKRHLCEFTGLDLEMAIDAHYNEALGG